MSSKDLAVSVRGLSKSYTIAHNDEKHTTLAEALVHRAKNPFARRQTETFWALKDLDFEIEKGDVVGIIGRNGAGKSTLLKILSRITEPTRGVIDLYGRVGSLLEVGTGFHPELTGRENIYLNGAILGMRRSEIQRQFDAIVDFSEVSQFLDTPVKRYSSGMYVRLAFAVAAHLNPEILIVDEVLAVGDVSFQKKCLGKMGDVSRQEGKTVLFVSHNMAAVEKLCRSCILLAGGQIVVAGETAAVMSEYLDSRAAEVDAQVSTALADRKDRQGEGQIRLTALTICDANGVPVEAVASGESIQFRLGYQCCEPGPNTNVTAAIAISTHSGNFITMLSNELSDDQFELTRPSGVFTCRLPKLTLSAGHYLINVAVNRNSIMQDWIQEAATLTVESGDYFGTGRTPPPSHGGVYFHQQWSVD